MLAVFTSINIRASVQLHLILFNLAAVSTFREEEKNKDLIILDLLWLINKYYSHLFLLTLINK